MSLPSDNNLVVRNGLVVLGGLTFPYTAKSSTYTITGLDHLIDCTSGTFTVTLPTAVGIAGKHFIVKNSGAGTITVATTSSQTIDGSSTISLLSDENVQVHSDGTNWVIVGSGMIGDQGDQGNQGAPGSNGYQGDQGNNGSQGYQGDQGNNGAQGDQGNNGAQGDQGNQGDNGAQGYQGDNGSQGYQGDNGSQGYQGDQGNNGSQGDQGNNGAQGDQGNNGEQGYQGDQGWQGYQGDQGNQGNNGSFGGVTVEYLIDTTSYSVSDPGDNYVKLNNANITLATHIIIDDNPNNANIDLSLYLNTVASSTSTIQGHLRLSKKNDATVFALYTISNVAEVDGGVSYFDVTVAYLSGSGSFSDDDEVLLTFARTGDKGDSGYQGAQGDQGGQGYQGDQGYQGSQGQGYQGDQGSQGGQGEQGSQGSQGQGYQGDQGAQGSQGFGSQGDQGAQGAQGQGSQGYQGDQGAQGSQGFGSQGDQGAQGSQGQGYQGEQGAQGSQGFGSQGDQGNQGNQGNQGPAYANTATITSQNSNYVVFSYADTYAKAVFIDYYVKNGSNAYRSGTITGVVNSSANTVSFTEVSVDDLGGTTSGIAFSLAITSNQLELTAVITSGTWDGVVGIRSLG